MNSFTIQPNECLRQSIRAFYHDDYSGGGQWKVQGTIENIICTLKNDITPYTNIVLQNAVQKLIRILSTDLPQIQRQTGKNNLTVCVIPRAKVSYNNNQLLFKATITDVVNRLQGFQNGTNYIIRHTDTKTTHLSRGISGGGNGRLPYRGITKETCHISNAVRGKDVLLIDDLYTKTVNIDEDAIQALIDNGASSVVFYSVGKTLESGYSNTSDINNDSYKKTDELYLLPEIYKETYSLLRSRNNIEQIAATKGLRTETIIKHITEISKILGNKSVEFIKPPFETINKVRLAVSKIGNRDKLRPIFDELDERVSYNEIRLSLLFIG